MQTGGGAVQGTLCTKSPSILMTQFKRKGEKTKWYFNCRFASFKIQCANEY